MHYCIAVLTKNGTENEIDKALKPFQENCGLEEVNKKYLKFFEDEDSDIDEETGKRGYWANPNAEWDWYRIGGRYAGHLYSKTNKAWADILPVKDIDFDYMKDFALKNLEPFEAFKENSYYRREYLDLLYPDEKTYRYKESRFGTYGVLDTNGVFHKNQSDYKLPLSEQVKMEEKFFENYFKTFIEPAIQQDLYLAMVDIHI